MALIRERSHQTTLKKVKDLKQNVLMLNSNHKTDDEGPKLAERS